LQSYLQLLAALPGMMSNVLDVRVLVFASVFQHPDISRTRPVLAIHQPFGHTALLACRLSAKNNKSMVHVGHRSDTYSFAFRTEPSEHIQRQGSS
jgi:hypothetical protein